MNQSQTICPQCGAERQGFTGRDDQLRCEYCGTLLRVEAPVAKVPQPPARISISSPVPADVPAQGLPPEYRQLKRPKPSAPLANSGCSLVFGLFWTLFSAIFVVAGIGFYVSGYQEYNRLVQEGVPAWATITKLEVDDSGDSTSYYVYYQFRAMVNGDVTRFEDYDSVSSTLYNSLKAGQQIEILYATSDPNLTVIKSEFKPPSLLFSLVFSGMGGLFVLIGLAMLYGGLKAQGHLRELRSQGRQARAFIFDRWQDKDSDGDPTYFVAFAFTVNQQIITHAEQNKILYDKYQIGDWLSVRYLPDIPSICQAQVER